MAASRHRQRLYVGQDGIDPGVDFDAIDRGDIQGMALDSPDPTTGLTRYLINPGASDVIVYRTANGGY
ncbi:MAG: hypothetical protein P8130_13100 [Deltaproteobacteria bacterium]